MRKTFEELGVSEPIRRAIEELGFVEPMPVQEAVIPCLLASKNDMIALAQTGTGKTAAFGIPLLQSVDTSSRETQALVLSPTRELCLQIVDDLRDFAKYLPGVHVEAVYGGASIEPQIRALHKGVQIVVATPGRLIDLMNRGVARLDGVSSLVLDEADEMLNMGFSESIDTILEGIPQDRTTLLFSATMSREIEHIAKGYLKDPQEIVVGSRNEGAENVNHVYYMVHAKDKYLALKRIVDFHPRIFAIVFCRTKVETQEVADKLIRDGYNAESLHGDLSQQQRDLTMQKFRNHLTQLLVATDVAARGLDVDDLTHVINYGLPDDIENYTHRSGRTGRAGKKGTSISIVHSRERHKIRNIEREIGKQFTEETIPKAEDICKKQLYKVMDQIVKTDVEEEQIAPFMADINRFFEYIDKEDVIKKIVSREFGRFLAYYADAPEIEPVKEEKGERKGRKTADEKAKGAKRPVSKGYGRLYINLGKDQGFYPGEVMQLLNKHLRGRQPVGHIELMDSSSYIEVPKEDVMKVMRALDGTYYHNRQIRCHTENKNYNAAPAADSRRGSDDGFRRGSDDGFRHGNANGSRRKERGNKDRAPRSENRKADNWRRLMEQLDNEQQGEGWARRKPRKSKR